MTAASSLGPQPGHVRSREAERHRSGTSSRSFDLSALLVEHSILLASRKLLAVLIASLITCISDVSPCSGALDMTIPLPPGPWPHDQKHHRCNRNGALSVACHREPRPQGRSARPRHQPLRALISRSFRSGLCLASCIICTTRPGPVHRISISRSDRNWAAKFGEQPKMVLKS